MHFRPSHGFGGERAPSPPPVRRKLIARMGSVASPTTRFICHDAASLPLAPLWGRFARLRKAMKHLLRQARTLTLAALFAAPLATNAQTPFAGEDFDEGSTNGGFTATSMVFTPDNSAQSIRNAFGGSRFDRFGEVSRLDGPGEFPTGEGLPFGVRDDSVLGNPQTFEGDTEGFVSADKTDDFVLSIDTVNDDNPNADGSVSATWTFDITGRSNLGLSMDFGMLGDFEEDDVYEFSYSIDGGTSALAFNITGQSGTFYSYTMDDGTFIDRFEDNFFSPDDWDVLTQIGEFPGDIEFHPDDDGVTNGDTTAQDGFIPVTFADGVEDVRATRDINDNGTFDEVEFAPVQDPLVITSGDGTLNGEVIPADFTTFSTALEGTGSVLTLTLNGVSDGGDEWFAFDNILLSEGEADINIWDYEPDGDVDITDFGFFADAFNNGSPLPGTDGYGDGEPDGDVDITDFGNFADAFNASATGTAIPEPTTAVLVALAAAGLAARRIG